MSFFFCRPSSNVSYTSQGNMNKSGYVQLTGYVHRLHCHPGVTLCSYKYNWIVGGFRRLAKKPKVRQDIMHALVLVRHQ